MIGNIDQQVNGYADAYAQQPDKLADSYRKNGDLMKLLALQKMKKERDSVANQMALSQPQSTGTIAQQLEKDYTDNAMREMVGQQDKLQKQQAKVAQQQASSGIATAPTPNMARMASGGIVGFAGPQGSYVDAGLFKPGSTQFDTSYGVSPYGPMLENPVKSRKKELERMIKEGRLDAEDVEALTNFEYSAKIVDGKPVVERAFGADPYDPTVMDSPVKGMGRMFSAPFKGAMNLWDTAGRTGPTLGELSDDFMAGIRGPSTPATEPIPEPTTEPTAEEKPTGAVMEGTGVLQSSQNKPEGIAGLTGILGGAGGAGGAGVPRTGPDLSSAEGILKFREQFYPEGGLPSITNPEIKMPTADDMVTKYGNPLRDWRYDAGKRSDEVAGRYDAMLAERQALYDELNNPTKAEGRRIIEALAGGAGKRNIGNVGRGIAMGSLEASDRYDAHRRAAMKELQDFEVANILGYEDKQVQAAADAGSAGMNAALPYEMAGARDTATRDYDIQKGLRSEAIQAGDRGIETILKGREIDARNAETEARRTSATNESLRLRMNQFSNTAMNANDKLSEYIGKLEFSNGELAAAKRSRDEARQKYEDNINSSNAEVLRQAAFIAQERYDAIINDDPVVKKYRQIIEDMDVQIQNIQDELGGYATNITPES